MNEEKITVEYPGHLGPEPVTRLRNGRAVRWSKGKQVELPRQDALDLIRLSGFLEVKPTAADEKPARRRRATEPTPEPAAEAQE